MALNSNAQSIRGTTGGKFALELEGEKGGWIREVEGGVAVADVVSEKIGSDHLTKKHVATVKYEPISFKVGSSMSSHVYEWIKRSFGYRYGRKNGAIILADFDSNEMSRLTFTNALVTEFGLPALDAASKDAALMTVKAAPEYTRRQKSNGKNKISGSAFPIDSKKQKQWLPSNFRLDIDGLDCSKVNKIDALVLKQKVQEHAIGEMRDYELEPSNLEVPNLVITLAESHADLFYAWHEDFVIKGNNTEDKEKTATLQYLSANLHDVLFTVTLKNLGVFKVAPDKVEAGGDSIRRVKVEMYCEDMVFEYTKDAVQM